MNRVAITTPELTYVIIIINKPTTNFPFFFVKSRRSFVSWFPVVRLFLLFDIYGIHVIWRSFSYHCTTITTSNLYIIETNKACNIKINTEFTHDGQRLKWLIPVEYNNNEAKATQLILKHGSDVSYFIQKWQKF